MYRVVYAEADTKTYDGKRLRALGRSFGTPCRAWLTAHKVGFQRTGSLRSFSSTAGPRAARGHPASDLAAARLNLDAHVRGGPVSATPTRLRATTRFARSCCPPLAAPLGCFAPPTRPLANARKWACRLPQNRLRLVGRRQAGAYLTRILIMVHSFVAPSAGEHVPEGR
jgi:hypothetical protein